MYTPDIGQAILDKLHERKWYAYYHTRGTSADATIRQGPAEYLIIDNAYVLLPQVSDPRDPLQVHRAIENLAVRLHRDLTTITFYGHPFQMIGFTPHPLFVKTHTPEGFVVSYVDFLEGLETLVQGA